jgi:5-methyltetrahydrofolate--homocysteine methyltransferase
VIAISNDESGISTDPKVRLEVARRIVARAESYGIPREDILVDPLVMPVGAVGGAGKAVLDLVRSITEDLGCNTVCGASNVSFGLPDGRR